MRSRCAAGSVLFYSDSYGECTQDFSQKMSPPGLNDFDFIK